MTPCSAGMKAGLFSVEPMGELEHEVGEGDVAGLVEVGAGAMIVGRIAVGVGPEVGKESVIGKIDAVRAGEVAGDVSLEVEHGIAGGVVGQVPEVFGAVGGFGNKVPAVIGKGALDLHFGSGFAKDVSNCARFRRVQIITYTHTAGFSVPKTVFHDSMDTILTAAKATDIA